MVVLVTSKNEEDLIKNEGTRVFTTLKINFSCMSSLPARMRMIESKMKELECSQDFSHYKSMGIFPDAQGQLTPQSLVRYGRILNSSEMLWIFSLPASMSVHNIFPIISLWELSVAMDTRVLIRSGPKPNASFPPTL